MWLRIESLIGHLYLRQQGRATPINRHLFFGVVPLAPWDNLGGRSNQLLGCCRQECAIIDIQLAKLHNNPIDGKSFNRKAWTHMHNAMNTYIRLHMRTKINTMIWSRRCAAIFFHKVAWWNLAADFDDELSYCTYRVTIIQWRRVLDARTSVCMYVPQGEELDAASKFGKGKLFYDTPASYRCNVGKYSFLSQKTWSFIIID